MTVFWTCFPRAAALPLIALHPSGTSATTCTGTRAITSRAHNVWQEALATGPADPTEAPQESPSAAPAVEVLVGPLHSHKPIVLESQLQCVREHSRLGSVRRKSW